MAFVNTNPKVGDFVLLKKSIMLFNGHFEKGTIVKIVGIGERGYDLEDTYGNRATETGWTSIEPIPNVDNKKYERDDISIAIRKLDQVAEALSNTDLSDVIIESVKTINEVIILLNVKACKDIIYDKKEN